MHEVKEMIDHVIEKALVFLETFIAVISVIVLMALLATELVHCFTDPSFFEAEDAISNYLHEMLSIVVALEFIKLLLHLTPANILEVLTMAIARGIIVNHGSAVDNLLSIACIIGMFAARRYLIPRNELYRDMDDVSYHTPRKHRHGKKHEDKHTEKQESKQEAAH